VNVKCHSGPLFLDFLIDFSLVFSNDAVFVAHSVSREEARREGR
jgi:hypothetical protein